MFQIIGYCGNTNQNHNEISLYILWDGFNRKAKGNRHWLGCGEIAIPTLLMRM